MPDPTSTSSSPNPSPVHAALIAAEATMRHNDDVSAVFVVTSSVPDRPEHPRDVVTILRMADVDAAVLAEPGSAHLASGMEVRGGAHAHVPHWARVLLDSTEGVR